MARFKRGQFVEYNAAIHASFEAGVPDPIVSWLADHPGVSPKWALTNARIAIQSIQALNPPAPPPLDPADLVSMITGLEDAVLVDNLVRIGPAEWGELRTVRVWIEPTTTVQDVLDEIQQTVDQWSKKYAAVSGAMAYSLVDFWRVQ